MDIKTGRGLLCTKESEGCVLIIMDEAIITGIKKLQALWREKREKKKKEEEEKKKFVTNIYLNIYEDF